MSAPTRKPLVVANWKMHGSLAANIDWAKAFFGCAELGPDAVDIAVCPPHIYLQQMLSLLDGSSLKLGCQNAHQEESGAYTGEIALAMLKDFRCHYVILGHSERRQIYAESDTLVAQKVDAALRAGFSPILCIGETVEQRQSNETEAVLYEQITQALALADKAGESSSLVLAYEPIWAIGSGLSASAEQAEEGCAYVRSVLAEALGDDASRIRILYGGSINEHNAASLFALPNVDGGLIGGASLDGKTFHSMCEAAAQTTKE